MGDGGRDSASVLKMLVGGVDDGIYLLSGQVSQQHLDCGVGVGHIARLRDCAGQSDTVGVTWSI